jgi:hypothetical protein
MSTIKDRAMDNVQYCDSYIIIPTSQTYRSYSNFPCLAYHNKTDTRMGQNINLILINNSHCKYFSLQLTFIETQKNNFIPLQCDICGWP